MEKQGIKIVALNREARHEYFIEEEYEAGIELCGTEVKSIRAGTLNLKDAWCGIKDGELLVNQMHISPYEHGNIFNRDPRRVRRLLMHKRVFNHPIFCCPLLLLPSIFPSIKVFSKESALCMM